MAASPLPDFTAAGMHIQQAYTATGRHLQQASTEIQTQFQRMNLLPTIQLQDIVNQLAQIRQDMAQMRQDMAQRFDQLEAKVDRLDSRMGHHNTNSMARLQNTYCGSSTDYLIGLINPATGEAIPHMPADSASIGQMTAPQIRAVLQQLGQVVPNNQPGGIAVLRRQLRVQLGLRAEPAPVA